MEKVEVRNRFRDGDLPRHAVAGLQKRPVEALSVKGDEYTAVIDAIGERRQDWQLLVQIAHEVLFNLEADAVPPRDSHEKSVRASSAGQPCGLRIEKHPLPEVRGHVFGVGPEQMQRCWLDRYWLGFGEPLADFDVFAIFILLERSPQTRGD